MKKLIVCSFVVVFSCSLHAELLKKETGKQISLTNDEIHLTIDKSSARIIGLEHRGKSLLAPNQTGYFTFKAGIDGAEDETLRIQNCTSTVHLETPDTIDLCFVPEHTPTFPFDMEIHYVLREGESGFYFYLVTSKEANTPDARFNQLRFAMRMDYSMLNIRLNDDLYGVLPSAETIRNSIGKVMDATFMTPEGEDVTKYVWSCPTGDAPVYGLNNGRQGAWVIRGGSDYLCGGPTKQHNTCHATDSGPIILNNLYSNHYGSDGSYVSNGSRRWSKIFGPTFVYLNQSASPDALWEDARQQASVKQDQWPYKWMDQPEYPTSRATVSGRFENAVAGWVVLARPKEYRGLDWQRQGGDTYIARAPIEKDGSFALTAVRKGNYSLYAFSPGIVGEFRKDNVVIDSAGKIDLGNLDWEPRKFGDLLWRIGTPDRTAAEFRHGDDYRSWGLWFEYAGDFPNDVQFKIGESNERTDWNYAQMAVWEEAGGWGPRLDSKEGDGRWKLPVWKILFDTRAYNSGLATLTLAIAGVNRPGEITASLNGRQLGTVEFPHGDSSIHRSGISGIFEERFISFDASLLRKGTNELSLQFLAKTPKSRLNYSHSGVMYDFVQLEVEGG